MTTKNRWRCGAAFAALLLGTTAAAADKPSDQATSQSSSASAGQGSDQADVQTANPAPNDQSDQAAKSEAEHTKQPGEAAQRQQPSEQPASQAGTGTQAPQAAQNEAEHGPNPAETSKQGKQLNEAPAPNQAAQSEAEHAKSPKAAQEAGEQSSQAKASAEGTAGTPSAHGKKTVDGTIVSVTSQQVVVHPADGQPDVMLNVDSGTQISGGKVAQPGELKEGTSVRASYEDKGGQPKASKIEVTGAAPDTAPSSK